MKLTVAYCVGGGDKYYKCLEKSINSLSRIRDFDINIVVLDINNKIKSHGNIKVINEIVNEDEINHYQFLRYKLHKYVDTGYTLYLDVDTVFVNDNLVELISSNHDFFISKHFWIENSLDYYNKTHPTQKYFNYLYNQNSESFPYIASGIFMFNDNSFNILKEVENKFVHIYEDNKDEKIGITDELVLSSVLKAHENVKLIGGGFNHCAHPPYMPLKLEDGVLYGKNPKDYEWEIVTHLHADASSRNLQFGEWPPKSYGEELQMEIKKCFYL